MDKLTAIIVTAVLSTGFAAAIGFCVWLVKNFLTKTTEHIEKLLDRDRANLSNKIGNIEKLLDRDRAILNEKIGRIEKQLSNHITDTNKKIEKLAEGQADLAVKIAEGQAKLETKISDGQAELFKLLSLKSPDKKQ